MLPLHLIALFRVFSLMERSLANLQSPTGFFRVQKTEPLAYCWQIKIHLKIKIASRIFLEMRNTGFRWVMDARSGDSRANIHIVLFLSICLFLPLVDHCTTSCPFLYGLLYLAFDSSSHRGLGDGPLCPLRRPDDLPLYSASPQKSQPVVPVSGRADHEKRNRWCPQPGDLIFTRFVSSAGIWSTRFWFLPRYQTVFFLLCEPAALILFFAEWKKRALYVSVFCLSYVILITIFHQTVHTNTHTQTPIRSMYSLTSISVLRKFVPIVVVSTPHRGNWTVTSGGHRFKLGHTPVGFHEPWKYMLRYEPWKSGFDNEDLVWK